MNRAPCASPRHRAKNTFATRWDHYRGAGRRNFSANKRRKTHPTRRRNITNPLRGRQRAETRPRAVGFPIKSADAEFRRSALALRADAHAAAGADARAGAAALGVVFVPCRRRAIITVARRRAVIIAVAGYRTVAGCCIVIAVGRAIEVLG